MAIRTSTNSIIRALGTITRNDTEMVNTFKKIDIKQSIFKDVNFYQEYIIQESVPFGDWVMQMNFVILDNGGSCQPGCHGEKSYTREITQ